MTTTSTEEQDRYVVRVSVNGRYLREQFLEGTQADLLERIVTIRDLCPEAKIETMNLRTGDQGTHQPETVSV